MNEYLGELSGTLARSQQRKNTVLSHIHKQAQLEKRAAQFGFAVRPSNPSEVQDLKAARHFLNEVRGELGHHVARINNRDVMSLERDGEIAVRQLNDAIHRLILVRNQWVRHCAQLSGGAGLTDDERAIVDALQHGIRPRKKFFGCAMELPEAKVERERREAQQAAARDAAAKKETSAKRPRPHNEDESDDSTANEEAQLSDSSDSLDASYGDLDVNSAAPCPTTSSSHIAADPVVRYLNSIKSAHVAATTNFSFEASGSDDDAVALERTFRSAERRADEQIRKLNAAACRSSSASAALASPSLQNYSAYVFDYCSATDALDCPPNIPSDDDVRRALIDRKKAAMKAQLAALKR